MKERYHDIVLHSEARKANAGLENQKVREGVFPKQPVVHTRVHNQRIEIP